MTKKSFKESAASLFFTPPEDVQKNDSAQVDAQQDAQIQTQQDTHDVTLEERRPIRTQGRKGKKKPRINMAFEPDIYFFIREQAEREDKSVTQYVNDVLYRHMIMHKK